MAKEYRAFVDIFHPANPDGMKFLDWEKAEQICQQHPDSTIHAGLREDWGWTSGVIFDHGKFYDGGILYNQSRWATPILDIDGEEIECWSYLPLEFEGVPDWWGRGEVVYTYDGAD